MNPVTTAEEATAFWTTEGARMDALVKNLEHLLPKNAEGPYLGEDSLAEAVDAFGDALLAMDTIAGVYARVSHQERTAVQQFQPQTGGQYARAAGTAAPAWR